MDIQDTTPEPILRLHVNKQIRWLQYHADILNQATDRESQYYTKDKRGITLPKKAYLAQCQLITGSLIDVVSPWRHSNAINSQYRLAALPSRIECVLA
jgi:hypothetical protein